MTESHEHHCDVAGCDGTRLGHDLAAEFPEETARFDAAMDALRARVIPPTSCTCGRVWEGHPNPHAITCPMHVTPSESTEPPPCENHREVQHRDRKPPWCNACGWQHAKPGTPAAQLRGTPSEMGDAR